MSEKWVYRLDDSDALSAGKEILGGKGFSLVKMHHAGYPIPPAVILTTKACIHYLTQNKFPVDFWKQVEDGVSWIGERMGRRFADLQNPLMVSVRSGAPLSFPGLMNTIKNVGVTKKTIELAVEPAEKTFFLSCYEIFKREYKEALSKAKSSKSGDPWFQLKECIEAVFQSWNSKAITGTRESLGIDSIMGTACVIQAMVFGNRDSFSGSGVFHTRDTENGEKTLRGDFLYMRQGDAVVGGTDEAKDDDWPKLMNDPQMASDLERYARELESDFGWVQDVEFTIETGKLFFLQSRDAGLSPFAKVKVSANMLHEGLLPNKRFALRYSLPAIPHLFIRKFYERQLKDKEALTRGINVVRGAVSGRFFVAKLFDKEPAVIEGEVDSLQRRLNELKKENSNVIIVTDHMDARQLGLVARGFDGIIGVRGGKNSHLAMIARHNRIPSITGCSHVNVGDGYFTIDDQRFAEASDFISFDGGTGNVYGGYMKTFLDTNRPTELDEIQKWSRELDWTRGEDSLSPWAVSTYLELKDAELERLKSEIPRSGEDIIWKTEKAKVIEMLMRTFPKGSRIGMSVLAAHDKNGLLRELYRSVDDGFEPGVRTAFQGNPIFGKAPWEMGLNKELAKMFVDGDPDYVRERRSKPDGNWGPYPEWIKEPHLAELIVMDNPRGLGQKDESSRARHFVFNVQCDDASNEVVIELILNTDQLRDIEKLEPGEKGIYITMQLDQSKPYYRGSIHYRIGTEYLMTPSNTEIGFWKTEASRYGNMIQPKANNIIRWIEKKVFKEWWLPPFALPYRMVYLSRNDLDVLEVQGRCDLEGNVEYAVIYDAKGREESGRH